MKISWNCFWKYTVICFLSSYTLPLCCVDFHTFLFHFLSGTVLSYFLCVNVTQIFCMVFSKWTLHFSYLIVFIFGEYRKFAVDNFPYFTRDKFTFQSQFLLFTLKNNFVISTLLNYDFLCSRLKIIVPKPDFY